jgi:hypothetical protein
VINAVNAAYAAGGNAPGHLATQLDNLNNSGCPLGGTPANSSGVVASDISNPANFTAYPVPFKDNLTIRYDFDYKTNVTIQILDAKGALLQSQDDTNVYLNKEVVIQPKFNVGEGQMFFIKVITDRGVAVKKVISRK